MAQLQKAYLGATPLFRNTSFFEDDAYTLVDTSSTVTVTANSSAHTKGAWSEIIATTSANASLVYVIVDGIGASNADTSTLLDIGTGASGSETALVSNIAVGGAITSAVFGRFNIEVPVKVPAGARISARIQSLVTGGKTASVTVKLYDMGDYVSAPTSVDVIGADTTTSTGVEMVTANTYQEITSSTSQDYRAIVLVPNVAGTSTQAVIATYTLAKGASGSEAELGSRDCGYNNAEFVTIFENPIITASVPSGTRLAVKIQGPTVNIGNYGVTLIGIP